LPRRAQLLILAHHPSENGTAGVIGKTPVDECLEFVRGEIKELVTDFMGEPDQSLSS
jgi:hypothetical protein